MIYDTIFNEIQLDKFNTSLKSEHILKLYRKSSQDQKDAIDSFCLMLCGYELKSIIKLLNN